MNRTELHPVEALLLVSWLALEAAATVLVALVALLLAIAPQGPSHPAAEVLAAPADPPIPADRCLPPVVHPLHALAQDTLEGLTVSELRRRARQLGLKALARTGRRTDLLQALALQGMAAMA
jgi:hypothetical protein